MAELIKPKIILIDDEPSFLIKMTSLLGDEYECYTSVTGEMGVLLHRQLIEHNPLVICDVNLPDISGFDVCKQVKSESSQTYVILLTNYNDNHSRMSGLKAYADQYLDKVMGNEELRLLIRNACLTFTKSVDEVAPVDEESEVEELSGLDDCFETEIKSLIQSCYDRPQSHNRGRECSLVSIAEKMNMAQRTFQREIKRVTGHTYKQLHLIVRLEKSRELFDKGYNVTQVADFLSFSSPAHLSRSFKEQFGETPSKYRQEKLGAYIRS